MTTDPSAADHTTAIVIIVVIILLLLAIGGGVGIWLFMRRPKLTTQTKTTKKDTTYVGQRTIQQLAPPQQKTAISKTHAITQGATKTQADSQYDPYKPIWRQQYEKQQKVPRTAWDAQQNYSEYWQNVMQPAKHRMGDPNMCPPDADTRMLPRDRTVRHETKPREFGLDQKAQQIKEQGILRDQVEYPTISRMFFTGTGM